MVSSLPPTSTDSSPLGPFSPISSSLYGSAASPARASSPPDRPPGEPLALLDDLPHPLLDGFKIIGPEWLRYPEVVIEPVLDRRADAQLGVGEELLDRLGEHVRGR